jgi:glucokinase
MSGGPDGDAPYYVGIDLGGTNIKCGVVDDSGRPRSQVSVETRPRRGPEEGLRTIAAAAQRAVAEAGVDWKEIAAVGLGSPGTLDLETGTLLDPPNLPGWTNVPIRQRVAELLGKPTAFQNDGNAAAFGEYWAGAGRGTRSLVLFTLGTGIGCGIVHDGQILEGRHSAGAECGHLIVQMENARQCPCGGYGHLEAYASATALVKRAREALETNRSSILHRLVDENALTSQAIADAACAGDPLARSLMRETARYLAVGAVCLMNTIDPDIILFGGGMIAAGSSLLDAIREDIGRMAFARPAALTRVEFAALGSAAGFIGAAGCARAAFPSL